MIHPEKLIEVKPAQMSTIIWVDAKDAGLANMYGVDLKPHGNPSTFDQAVVIIHKLKKAIPQITYQRDKRRLTAVMNGFIFAFGPDMEEHIMMEVDHDRPRATDGA